MGEAGPGGLLSAALLMTELDYPEIADRRLARERACLRAEERRLYGGEERGWPDEYRELQTGLGKSANRYISNLPLAPFSPAIKSQPLLLGVVVYSV